MILFQRFPHRQQIIRQIKNVRRHLHLHEYQSKELMASFGVNTQRFVIASSATEAAILCSSSLKESLEFVVKAQVLAGGRGKGTFTSGLQGGVHLTRDIARVGELVTQMVGHRLITHQTTSKGVPVHQVMIAEARDLAKETYFAIVLDRTTAGPVMVASPQGGVDIESVAEHTPELILKVPIDLSGPTPDQLVRLANFLGLDETESIRNQAMDQMQRLFKLFTSVDATQVEVNPFGLTPQGEILCFDAKLNFDDNASFRHPQLFKRADTHEIDPRELSAATLNLNYISMDGNIGCLVNGAGLAMATMDLLALHGGRPANFLDVGGGAQPDQIAAAYNLLLTDDRVRAIFVNIFGGIMRCDLIAEGILRADSKRSVPLVVRLAGTNDVMAKERLLKEYPGVVQVFDDLDLAAQKAVLAATATLEN